MSNFNKLTIHPLTGKEEQASWIDVGTHYLVQFSDGKSFMEDELRAVEYKPKGELTMATLNKEPKLTAQAIEKYKKIHLDSAKRFGELYEAIEDGSMKNALCHAKHIQGNDVARLNIINKAEGKG